MKHTNDPLTPAILAYMQTQLDSAQDAEIAADGMQSELLTVAETMERQAQMLRRFIAGDTTEEVTSELWGKCRNIFYEPISIDGFPAVLRLIRNTQ